MILEIFIKLRFSFTHHKFILPSWDDKTHAISHRRRLWLRALSSAELRLIWICFMSIFWFAHFWAAQLRRVIFLRLILHCVFLKWKLLIAKCACCSSVSFVSCTHLHQRVLICLCENSPSWLVWLYDTLFSSNELHLLMPIVCFHLVCQSVLTFVSLATSWATHFVIWWLTNRFVRVDLINLARSLLCVWHHDAVLTLKVITWPFSRNCSVFEDIFRKEILSLWFLQWKAVCWFVDISKSLGLTYLIDFTFLGF